MRATAANACREAFEESKAVVLFGVMFWRAP
jgi:hypothetical protein